MWKRAGQESSASRGVAVSVSGVLLAVEGVSGAIETVGRLAPHLEVTRVRKTGGAWLPSPSETIKDTW